jgi:pimeloyl-ACP methyl ester carboxylesterase
MPWSAPRCVHVARRVPVTPGPRPGGLDNWDPVLVDALAHNRRVVTFDNAGVAGSTGTTPSTIAQMARDAIAFLEALELGAVDLLGFSIGSFAALLESLAGLVARLR